MWRRVRFDLEIPDFMISTVRLYMFVAEATLGSDSSVSSHLSMAKSFLTWSQSDLIKGDEEAALDVEKKTRMKGTKTMMRVEDIVVLGLEIFCFPSSGYRGE